MEVNFDVSCSLRQVVAALPAVADRLGGLQALDLDNVTWVRCVACLLGVVQRAASAFVQQPLISANQLHNHPTALLLTPATNHRRPTQVARRV